MEKSPDAFRTISEVAEILETPAHVLRFWESRFPQIRPVKRAGGRRYYRPADVALLTGIKRLLHDEGMTIRGVQKILREQGVRYVSGMTDDTSTEDDDAALEAALIASTGGDAAAQPLPPAEAESAQIIALESALGDRGASTEPVEAAPDQDDMPAIARFPVSATSLSEVSPEESGDKASADDGISDLVTRMVASAASDDSSKAMQSPDMEELAEETEAPAMTDEAEDEAPMAVWAEEEAQETPEPVVPTLRVTRIGAAKAVAQPALPGFRPEAEPSAAEAPAAQPPDTEPAPALPEPETGPTLAARLRRTRAADLAASDRNTISVIRARARSLRDRLTSPIRSGH